MKFKIQDSRFKIICSILCCLLILFSFTRIELLTTSNYKTVHDSSFTVGDRILIPKVYFRMGKCQLQDSLSSVALNEVVDFLNREKQLIVSVDCHTDYVNPASSTKLTECRAISVLNYFVSAGIDMQRLRAKGYGDTKPFQLQEDVVLKSGKVVTKGALLTEKFLNTFKANPDDYQFLRSLNRRIEITILKIDSLK